MRMTFAVAVLGVSAFVIFSPPAHAQQDIAWTQVTNLPKGSNIPAGVRADILGIEIGDSYAIAKGKLERLLAESANPPKPAQAPALAGRPLTKLDAQLGFVSRPVTSGTDATGASIQEVRTQFRLDTGSAVGNVSFVSRLTLYREVAGSSKRNNNETIILTLSAPSSGHQVVAIRRDIAYHTEADQPRVADLRASLKEKFKADAQVFQHNWATVLLYRYNDGAILPNAPSDRHCAIVGEFPTTNSAVPRINAGGDCDVALRVEMRPGISADHAQTVIFELSDNERAKANFGADYTFFQNYIDSLRSKTKGAVPKL